jgi:hypothetical protein
MKERVAAGLFCLTLMACSTGTSAPTSGPVSQCEAAAPALLAAIGNGLTVTGGASLANGFVVKSRDFQKVYFVAARITGAGMSDTVGLWATNDPSGGGFVYSIDAFAREFSDWGDGSKTDAHLSESDDGGAAAKACAKAAGG